MPDEKTKLNRKSIRLPNYDYTQQDAYFITIVTHNRECLFGDVVRSQIQLSPIGNIVKGVWQFIPLHLSQASVNHFVIMPNHIHGIIIIDQSVGALREVLSLRRQAVPQSRPHQNFESFGKPVSGSIPTIIRSFKSEATRRVNIFRQTPGAKLWQRNYYEHVIRNEQDYQIIVDYILANPLNWRDDHLSTRS